MVARTQSGFHQDYLNQFFVVVVVVVFFFKKIIIVKNRRGQNSRNWEVKDIWCYVPWGVKRLVMLFYCSSCSVSPTVSTKRKNGMQFWSQLFCVPERGFPSIFKEFLEQLCSFYKVCLAFSQLPTSLSCLILRLLLLHNSLLQKKDSR